MNEFVLFSGLTDQSHGLQQEQRPDLSGSSQGDHGGQRRRGKVRPHPAVHVRRGETSRHYISHEHLAVSACCSHNPFSLLPVRGGLRAHQGRQLQEEGGAGRRGRADRHPGHGGSGGLRRHQRQLLPQRRRIPAGLLHHRARVLHSHRRAQVRLQTAAVCLLLLLLLLLVNNHNDDKNVQV